jgi:hypothetical protein
MPWVDPCGDAPAADFCGRLRRLSRLQVVTYRHNYPCEEKPVNLSLLGQLKGVGRGAPPARLFQPPLYGVHQLGEAGKAIQTRTAAYDLYGAVRTMLSESAEPNLTTSVPSFSPT